MNHKFSLIILNAIPILIMMGLIPLIKNDYTLTIAYICIIIISFIFKKEKNEIKIFLFGFVVMILAEAVFISTGVETFVRNTLLGLMPLWLPFLWGYSFVAMKRGLKILEL